MEMGGPERVGGDPEGEARQGRGAGEVRDTYREGQGVFPIL